MHQLKTFLASFEPIALMREHDGRIDAAILDESQQPLGPAASAGAESARELVMRYEAAEISRIYIQSGRGVCSDQIAYAAGRTSKLIRNGQLLRSASGYNRAIHLFAAGKVHYLLVDVAFLVVYDITGAIKLGKFAAVPP